MHPDKARSTVGTSFASRVRGKRNKIKGMGRKVEEAGVNKKVLINNSEAEILSFNCTKTFLTSDLKRETT